VSRVDRALIPTDRLFRILFDAQALRLASQPFDDHLAPGYPGRMSAVTRVLSAIEQGAPQAAEQLLPQPLFGRKCLTPAPANPFEEAGIANLSKEMAIDLSRKYRVAQVIEYGESGGQ
jgi:hypothetical protein